ncbi:ABC transporter permease, partial [Fusobacterium nucleatum]
MVRKILDKLYLILVFIFLYAPIAVLMVFSFNDSKLRGSWAGFTLRWYRALLEDSTILRSLYITLIVAVIATLISTVLGTFAA